VGKDNFILLLKAFFHVLPFTCGIKDLLARTTPGDDFFAVTPSSCHLSSPPETIEVPGIMREAINSPFLCNVQYMADISKTNRHNYPFQPRQ